MTDSATAAASTAAATAVYREGYTYGGPGLRNG